MIGRARSKLNDVGQIFDRSKQRKGVNCSTSLDLENDAKRENSMDTIKKRQHYVPKTYLRPFSNIGKRNDMIWAYFLKQKKPRFVALDDVCVERCLYEHYICYDDGETEFISPNSIENGYMQFENKYRSIIEKIIISPNDIISLTDEDRNILTGFMVSILFRHPTFINMANSLHEKIYHEHPEWRDELANKFPDIDDTYFKMSYLHRMLEMHQDPERDLSIQAMKNMLDEDQLCVFRTDSAEFITSDAPVVNVYGDINGLDYDLMGMPVSPKYFIAFIDIDKNVTNKIFVIDTDQTMSLNKHQYGHSATGIIMSKSKEELVKHIAELSE